MNERPDAQRKLNGGSDPGNPAPLDGVHVSEAVLSSYLDGELSDTERAAVREHLDACPECRTQLAELRATVAMLRALPMPAPRRSFQLGPDHARRASVWQRLGAFLLPSLPALRAATVAIALLLAAISIRNALVEPELRGPVTDAYPSSQSALTAPTETPASERNAAAIITNQATEPPAESRFEATESTTQAANAFDGTQAPIARSGAPAPDAEGSIDQDHGGAANGSETTAAEGGAPPSAAESAPGNAALKAPADSDTDALADEQAGAEPAAQVSISGETEGESAAGASEANLAMAAIEEESPVATPPAASPSATPSPTPSPTATPTSTPSPAPTAAPTQVAIPPAATTSSDGADGWRIAQLFLGAALIAMIALLALLRRYRPAR